MQGWMAAQYLLDVHLDSSFALEEASSQTQRESRNFLRKLRFFPPVAHQVNLAVYCGSLILLTVKNVETWPTQHIETGGLVLLAIALGKAAAKMEKQREKNMEVAKHFKTTIQLVKIHHDDPSSIHHQWVSLTLSSLKSPRTYPRPFTKRV